MPFRLGFVLVALLLLSGCGKPDKSPSASAASLAVSLVPAQTRQVQHTVIASGPITAWEEMQLGVELSGLRVVSLAVDVGQSVKKGQVLLRLDTRMLASDLRSAQAALGEAAAGVTLATINLDRGRQLAESKLISANALDELRAGLVRAQAHKATSRAQTESAQLRLDFATLRAPDDGVIAKRLVQPGQVVMAGSELLRLIRRGRLEWRAELAESELARVRVGMVAKMNDGSGHSIAGRVRAVTPGLDTSTHTGTAYISLPAPGALKAGMFVEGKLVTGQATALMIPVSAVIRRDGQAFVFEIDSRNIAHRVRVQLGDTDGNWIEILDGLKSGTAVVARGSGFLGDGDLVRVVTDKTTP